MSEHENSENHLSYFEKWKILENGLRLQKTIDHENQMVLARGLCGDLDGEPKVACPLHKNNFSLVDGHHLGGRSEFQLKTYPIKKEGGRIWIGFSS